MRAATYPQNRVLRMRNAFAISTKTIAVAGALTAFAAFGAVTSAQAQSATSRIPPSLNSLTTPVTGTEIQTPSNEDDQCEPSCHCAGA